MLKLIGNKVCKVFKTGYNGKLQKPDFLEQDLKKNGKIFKDLICKTSAKELQCFLKCNQDIINRTDENGNTPLHYAVLNNNIGAVKVLLDNKASTTTQNKHCDTPFINAQPCSEALNSIKKSETHHKINTEKQVADEVGKIGSYTNVHQRSTSHDNAGQVVQQNRHNDVTVLVEEANLSAEGVKEDPHKAKNDFRAKVAFFEELSSQSKSNSPKPRFNSSTFSVGSIVSSKLSEINLNTSRTHSLL